MTELGHLPRTLWCTGKYYVKKKTETETVGSVDPALFEQVLSQYDEDVVFVHAGLSDVSDAFETDPYEFLFDTLTSQFESVLVPGFTPSFRDTGVYDKRESVPQIGAFSRCFLKDAQYRTDDAIHSILVHGSYRFDDCDHHKTFGADGCFAKLDADNVLVVNVGTPWLISTQLHYIEMASNPPYAELADTTGEIRYADGEREQITQTSFDKNEYVYYWNREKIREDAKAAGVLEHHSLNGLTVMAFRTNDLAQFLEPKLEADPYYLVQ
ncbi:AAC(3) family N-acetyltransferase [Natronolimnobius sp. AArcel1]|uniref:AAC(3) family N-acetyltransferase n=1 Tax=Natronolimnobius sp. AArcel1 TaxID=1679093 RepID=UPI0013E9E4BF|nr:AAC(3) family N-acetyltransferase [Natronolimnobius sp. AArcel1]NGM67815.1 AAC(3) family N-acetyltransferase [Natronolimnobius sp. AArcel1]